MSRRGLRGLLVAATVAIAALAATQPIFASELSQTGTVGVHSLVDTSAHPAALGNYRYYSSDGFGWLKKFRVNPPNMRAVAGKTNQKVGWLFTVERKVCSIGGCGSWTVRYTSPEMTAYTDDAHNASFTQASVDVVVPCGHGCEDAGATYRITEKMIWHKANGSIQGTVRFRIHWYGSKLSIGETGVQETVAGDAWSPNW